MVYLIVIFLCGILLSIGIILLKKPFFSLAQHTTSLLDAMLLATEDEELKQVKVIHALKPLLVSLIFFLLLVSGVLLISGCPMVVYAYLIDQPIESFHYSGYSTSLVFIGGTILPFLIMYFITPRKDYSDWSKLLHRIALNNQNISKALFNAEARFFRKKIQERKSPFLIVSGLARAGTTALTTLLYESGSFHSLTYANMPFLLSPNIWRTVYRPRKGALRERSHGDKVLFGYNTVEALEEYFWKVFMQEKFIANDRLKVTEVGEDVYRKYRIYQDLLHNESGTERTLYLAKNNNFILRYSELRQYDENFVLLILFRDPLQQAFSLLNQHMRYQKLQGEDSFVAEYMNWLGHYEFGGNHKYFDFGNFISPVEHFNPNTIDYWLVIWVSYYTHVLNLPTDSKRVLLDYNDFLADPVKIINGIGKILGVAINTSGVGKFENVKEVNVEYSQDILKHAETIYAELKIRKTIFSL